MIQKCCINFAPAEPTTSHLKLTAISNLTIGTVATHNKQTEPKSREAIAKENIIYKTKQPEDV